MDNEEFVEPMENEAQNKVADLMTDLLTAMQDLRPTERSELARRWAVSITQMELATSYFFAWVMTAGDLSLIHI